VTSITFCLLLGATVALSVVNLHRHFVINKRLGVTWLDGLFYPLSLAVLTIWTVAIMMNWRKK